MRIGKAQYGSMLDDRRGYFKIYDGRREWESLPAWNNGKLYHQCLRVPPMNPTFSGLPSVPVSRVHPVSRASRACPEVYPHLPNPSASEIGTGWTTLQADSRLAQWLWVVSQHIVQEKRPVRLRSDLACLDLHSFLAPLRWLGHPAVAQPKSLGWSWGPVDRSQLVCRWKRSLRSLN